MWRAGHRCTSSIPVVGISPVAASNREGAEQGSPTVPPRIEAAERSRLRSGPRLGHLFFVLNTTFSFVPERFATRIVCWLTMTPNPARLFRTQTRLPFVDVDPA